MNPQTSMLGLAASIVQDVKALDAYINSSNLEQPSFAIKAPKRAPYVQDASVAQAIDRLLTSTRHLHGLVLGPTGYLGVMSLPEDLFALATIHSFEIAKHVPIHGETSFNKIAEQTGLPRNILTRIMRYAMTHHIFEEPRPGIVAHNACSRLLAEDSLVQGMVYMGCGERFAAAAKHVEALRDYPESEEPTLSGWGLANNAKHSMFRQLAEQYPARSAKVNEVMDALAILNRPEAAADIFDWASLGDAHVVDLAGGKGVVSLALAHTFPRLTLTVQDMSTVVESGEQALPQEYKQRIKFMPHDILNEQSILHADVYFMRMIVHNWSDKYCLQILRALIPALKNGARVLAMKPYIPAAGTMTQWEERVARSADLRMMIFSNGCDREIMEWEQLLAQVDPRLPFRQTHLSPSTNTNIGRTNIALFEMVYEAL